MDDRGKGLNSSVLPINNASPRGFEVIADEAIKGTIEYVRNCSLRRGAQFLPRFVYLLKNACSFSHASEFYKTSSTNILQCRIDSAFAPCTEKSRTDSELLGGVRTGFQPSGASASRIDLPLQTAS